MLQKVSILSLGCAKNLVHSETMMGLFQQQGYELTEQYDEAEIIIINTCGFVNAAKEESINAILEMAQWKEQGACKLLVAVGCLVQKYAKELAEEIPEVDIFVGTNDYQQIVSIIREHQAQQEIVVHTHWTEESKLDNTTRLLTTPSHYAYLRISEGCDNNCTYCVIPEMQGPHRSKTIEQIKREALDLVAQGVTELVLVGQDTSYYGKDLYGRFALVDLLKELAAIPEVRWIRLLYAYPNNFTGELIDYIASEEKVCNYLDIPLQHADDEVLQRMNRKITVAEMKALINKLRERIPGITLRSTFIVGFPGETEEQYKNLLDFLEEMQLDCVGAFPYSREEGTPADRMDGHLEEDEKEKRAENLMDLQYDTMYRKHEKAIGQRRVVKVDELSPDIPGLLLCRSEGEAPDVDPWILVYEVENHDYQPGDYFTVELTGLDEYDFIERDCTMNLPNKLTLARMCMVPLFMVALLMNTAESRIVAAAIFALASLTDMLDGQIARKYNLITNFGKLMDPLADKVLTASAMVCLVQLGDLAAWIVVIVLFREYGITGLRSVAASENIVIAAGIWGKVKTVCQMIALILLMLKPQIVALCGIDLGLWLMYVALVLTVYSGVDYVVKLNKQITWS